MTLYLYLYGFIIIIYVTFLLVSQWFCMSEIKFHDSSFIWPKRTNNIRVLDFWIT